MRALVLTQPEPRIGETLAQINAALLNQTPAKKLAALRVFCCPSARLSVCQLTAAQLLQIREADGLVFVSPFAIEAAAQCVNDLFTDSLPKLALPKVALPLVGLMGPGSADVFNKLINYDHRFNWVQPQAPDFDSTHLASFLAPPLVARRARSLVVLQGNRSGTTLAQWRSNLKAVGCDVNVITIDVYDSQPIDQTSAVQALQLEFTQCTVKDATFYFTSSSSVSALAASWPPNSQNLNCQALVIHPKIASAVKRYLGWPCRLIEPGLLALINSQL